MKTFNEALSNYLLVLALSWVIVLVGCTLKNWAIAITGAFLMTIGLCLYWIYHDIKHGKRPTKRE